MPPATTIATSTMFVQVLDHPPLDCKLVVPKKPERIPELLSPAEVARIIGATANPDQRLDMAKLHLQLHVPWHRSLVRHSRLHLRWNPL